MYMLTFTSYLYTPFCSYSLSKDNFRGFYFDLAARSLWHLFVVFCARLAFLNVCILIPPQTLLVSAAIPIISVSY